MPVLTLGKGYSRKKDYLKLKIKRKRGPMVVVYNFTKMKKIPPSEDSEQVKFVAWFRKNYTIKKGVRIFAIPNGGKRNIKEATRLKLQGVSAGIPDLYIPEWGLWIEMKRTVGGVLSAPQKDWIAYLNKIGQHAIVAQGCQEAVDAVVDFAEKMK